MYSGTHIANTRVISAEILQKGGEPMLVFFCELLDLFWWLKD